MAGPLGTTPTGTVKAPAQSSAAQNTAVGSGSRPGNVKMPIKDSAPTDQHTLGRAPPGWLK